MLDFHNHLIPAVEDGSQSLDESLSALDEMSKQGITHIITTPHFRASTIREEEEFAAQMSRFDAGWEILREGACQNFPRMKLGRGVELALDDPTPVVVDNRLRLAGTRFGLVEFPWFTIPGDSAAALARFKASGVTPIVAHPERVRKPGFIIAGSPRLEGTDNSSTRCFVRVYCMRPNRPIGAAESSYGCRLG